MRTFTKHSAWLNERIAVLSVMLLATAAAGTPAYAAPPPGLHLADVSGGGHLLEGAVAGSSPQRVFASALSDVRAALGSPASVVSATRSTDGTLTVALFRDTAGGTPLAGVIYAAYAGSASHVAVAYDRADRFPSTAPNLIARAGAATAQQSRAPVNPGSLRNVTAPDRSVRAAIPASWHVTTFAQGQFSATGPDGAEVDQELAARLIDPRSSAYQMALRTRPWAPYATGYGFPMSVDANPERAYITFANMIARAQNLGSPNITIERTIPQPSQPGLTLAEIIGTDSVKGVRMKFDGIVAVGAAGPMGMWMISVKMITAPAARLGADLATMAAVYNSYRVDQGVMGRQVAQTQAEDRAGAARGLALMQQTQAQNSATFNASMAHAQSVQNGIDRSTAGFTRYLSDTTVVQDGSGAHHTVSDSFADAIVKNDPEHFQVVPESEYRKGSEY